MSRDRGVGGATCRRLRHGRSIVVEVSVRDVREPIFVSVTLTLTVVNAFRT